MNQKSFPKKRNGKILVVEDDADLLELLCLSLREEGFAVATAADGLDAIQKARSVTPDLILLDVMLPELDGFAVCEVLRKNPITAPIPVIMVTAMSGQIPRCAGIESGATDFVTKPVTPAHLISKVRQVLQQVSTSLAARKRVQPGDLPVSPRAACS